MTQYIYFHPKHFSSFLSLEKISFSIIPVSFTL